MQQQRCRVRLDLKNEKHARKLSRSTKTAQKFALKPDVAVQHLQKNSFAELFIFKQNQEEQTSAKISIVVDASKFDR